jgi:hypothetical protein
MDPIQNDVYGSVVEASFYPIKPLTVREMVTRKINKSLCFCLMIAVVVAFVSYYIAMNYEAKLNMLDREIVRINTENHELQADLDRYKSFNNVDSNIGKYNLLQKADKVIEVTAMTSDYGVISPRKSTSPTFNWVVGY